MPADDRVHCVQMRTAVSPRLPHRPHRAAHRVRCHADNDRDDDAVATEEKIWDLTQAINVKGVWWGCKYAVLAMRNVSLWSQARWCTRCRCWTLATLPSTYQEACTASTRLLFTAGGHD